MNTNHPNTPDARTREQVIADIAQRILSVETLETRSSDRLDFHDVAVWTLREALLAAYEAGAATRTPGGC